MEDKVAEKLQEIAISSLSPPWIAIVRWTFIYHAKFDNETQHSSVVSFTRNQVLKAIYCVVGSAQFNKQPWCKLLQIRKHERPNRA